MKLMTLQQFIQQASEPEDPETQEVLVMTVRDFLDAIEASYEGDCTALVILDSPESNSISVKFFPLEEETEE